MTDRVAATFTLGTPPLGRLVLAYKRRFMFVLESRDKPLPSRVELRFLHQPRHEEEMFTNRKCKFIKTFNFAMVCHFHVMDCTKGDEAHRVQVAVDR